MGFFNSLGRLFAKAVVEEINMTPEDRERRKKQKEADELGRALGTELEYVETVSQEEYEQITAKEKEMVVHQLRTKGNNIVRRFKLHADHYRSSRISLDEMINAWEIAEKNLVEAFFKNTPTRGVISYDEIEELGKEYYDQLYDIKDDLGL